MKFRALLLFLLLVPGTLGARDKNATYRIPLPPKPDFSSLTWLLGDWAGQTTRHSPQGEVHLSISYGLNRRVMIFKEKISLAATEEAPAARESSIGILSADSSGNSFILQVYSSTGFITRYRVNVSGPEVNLNPIGGLEPPTGWLSRRLFERSDVDGFVVTVQLAPPQRPFFDYYTAFMTRAAPDAKSGSEASAKEKSK